MSLEAISIASSPRSCGVNLASSKIGSVSRISKETSNIHYKLALRLLIMVAEKEAISVRAIRDSTSYDLNKHHMELNEVERDLHAFYSAILLYLIRRPKAISLTALCCFVLRYAGNTFFDRFYEALRTNLCNYAGDVTQILAHKSSPVFLKRQSMIGAFISQLELDVRGLNFTDHIFLFERWIVYCNPLINVENNKNVVQSPMLELSEVKMLRDEWGWNWDVDKTAEDLILCLHSIRETEKSGGDFSVTFQNSLSGEIKLKEEEMDVEKE